MTAATVHLALQPRAAVEAKGMKEDGAAVGGMVNEGGALTQEFMLMPGKCYTILGQGLPAISEVDMTLSLKLPIPNVPAVLAADQTTGAVGQHRCGEGLLQIRPSHRRPGRSLGQGNEGFRAARRTGLQQIVERPELRRARALNAACTRRATVPRWNRPSCR